MAASPVDERFQDEDVASGAQIHPLKAAALVGGALAATAGAYYGSRVLARRNSGKVNSVMATAITAQDVAPATPETKPTVRAR
jgi:hypothetical protein